MNKGTKIRTALRVAVSLYTAFMIWQATVTSLGYKWLTIAWALLTIAAGWTVDALTTWYNNDYTPEACEGTGLTRLLKKQKEAGYNGEDFSGEDLNLKGADEDE